MKLFANSLDNLRSALALRMTQEYGRRESRKILDKEEKVKDSPTFVIRLKELDKGCLLYVLGKKEPIRAAIPGESVLVATVSKRMIGMLIEYFRGGTFFKGNNVFKKIGLVFSLAFNYNFYLTFVWNALEDYYYPNPDKYSQPVREVYRILSEFPKERDIICFWLETDMAYRYRFQDIIYELNIELFKKDQIKELLRLLDILISREIGGMDFKWKTIRKYVVPGLKVIKFFKPKLFKKVCQMVANINLEEIKSSKEDIYWQKDYIDYKFKLAN
jgi:hypothetical protein